jgi:hypothetical protein
MISSFPFLGSKDFQSQCGNHHDEPRNVSGSQNPEGEPKHL